MFIDGNTEQQAALVEILTAKDIRASWEILAATLARSTVRSSRRDEING